MEVPVMFVSTAVHNFRPKVNHPDGFRPETHQDNATVCKFKRDAKRKNGRLANKKRSKPISDCNSDYIGFDKTDFAEDYQQSNYTSGNYSDDFHMESFLDFQFS